MAAGEPLLDQLVEDAARAAQAPSLRAATFDVGGVTWAGEIGDVARQYRIGSITKTFTAVLVMRLRDEGRLDLNDRLGLHLPDAPYADATIRDLLAHRSGMTAEPAGEWWERTPGTSWSDLVAANAAETRVFAPAARHHYSNLGYALLGQLVARCRELSWYEAVTTELLNPLGLAGTTYRAGTGAAVGTSRNPLTGELQGEPAQDTKAMAPAGQLWSTPSDLATWARVIAGVESDLLALDSAVEMRTAQAAEPEDQHIGAYGLGLRLRWTPGGTLVGHTGSMPGFLAALFVDPVSLRGAVVMSNVTTGIQPEGLAADLIRTAAPARDDRAAERSPAEPVGPFAELAGRWYWGNTEMTAVVTPDGFRLTRRGEDAGFRATGEDRFVGLNDYWAGETLRVHRDASGAVRRLEVVTFILTRTPYDPDAPIPGGPPLPMG